MNDQMVISNSRNLPIVEEQVDYLLATGEYFIYQKRFREAFNVADYILNYLDGNSIYARKILTITRIRRR